MANNTPGNLRFIPRGIKLKVAPIRSLKHIEAIRKLLKAEDIRMLAFFIFNLAINNGLRSCDICNLKVSQVKDLPVKSQDALFLFQNVIPCNLHEILHDLHFQA